MHGASTISEGLRSFLLRLCVWISTAAVLLVCAEFAAYYQLVRSHSLPLESGSVSTYKEDPQYEEEFAMAENIRQILVNEQEHQIDLATALGKNVADVASSEELA